MSKFENKSKEILMKALSGCNLEHLDNCDDFQQEIQQDFAEEIGRAFMEELTAWNGDDTYMEIMEELKKEMEEDEE